MTECKEHDLILHPQFERMVGECLPEYSPCPFHNLHNNQSEERSLRWKDTLSGAVTSLRGDLEICYSPPLESRPLLRDGWTGGMQPPILASGATVATSGLVTTMKKISEWTSTMASSLETGSMDWSDLERLMPSPQALLSLAAGFGFVVIALLVIPRFVAALSWALRAIVGLLGGFLHRIRVVLSFLVDYLWTAYKIEVVVSSSVPIVPANRLVYREGKGILLEVTIHDETYWVCPSDTQLLMALNPVLSPSTVTRGDTNEMAVPNHRKRRAPHEPYVVSLVVGERTLGLGFRYGDFLITCVHVVDAIASETIGGEEAYLHTNTGKRLSLGEWPVGFYSLELDLIGLRVPAAVWAALGVKSSKLADAREGETVIVPSHELGKQSVSYGTSRAGSTVFSLVHDASTDPGDSGAPLISKRGVIGVHCGSVPSQVANRGVSLSFLIPRMENDGGDAMSSDPPQNQKSWRVMSTAQKYAHEEAEKEAKAENNFKAQHDAAVAASRFASGTHHYRDQVEEQERQAIARGATPKSAPKGIAMVHVYGNGGKQSTVYGRASNQTRSVVSAPAQVPDGIDAVDVVIEGKKDSKTLSQIAEEHRRFKDWNDINALDPEQKYESAPSSLAAPGHEPVALRRRGDETLPPPPESVVEAPKSLDAPGPVADFSEGLEQRRASQDSCKKWESSLGSRLEKLNRSLLPKEQSSSKLGDASPSTLSPFHQRRLEAMVQEGKLRATQPSTASPGPKEVPSLKAKASSTKPAGSKIQNHQAKQESTTHSSTSGPTTQGQKSRGTLKAQNTQ